MTEKDQAGDAEAALDTRQVAQRLLMHPDTVRDLAASGALPAHRVGRRFKYFWTEVRAALGEARSAERGTRNGKPTPHPGPLPDRGGEGGEKRKAGRKPEN